MVALPKDHWNDIEISDAEFEDIIKPTTQNTTNKYNRIPSELKNLRQWARYIKEDGRDKIPAHLNGRKMKWGTRSNWLSFDQVAPFDRIGGFTILENEIVKADYDGCVSEDGTIDPLVLKWIKNTYAEFSPSKKGIKAYFRGKLPNNKAVINTNVPWGNPGDKHTQIELYAHKRFFTITGDIVPGCPSEINEELEALNDMLTRFAPAPKTKKQKVTTEPKLKKSNDPLIFPNGYWSLDTWKSWCYKNLDVRTEGDGYLDVTCPWEHLHTTPGDTARIWYGPPHTVNCFHAHCNGRKWEDVRLLFEPTAYDWKKKRREYKSIKHFPSVPEITMEEQNEKLAQARQQIRAWVREHLDNQENSILLLKITPGVGKSRQAALEGKDRNIAYLIQRRDMIASIKTLQGYRIIDRCHGDIYSENGHLIAEANCPEANSVEILGKKGYNSWISIQKELCNYECDYSRQLQDENGDPVYGSAVYTLPYVKSRWPVQQAGIIIDEFNPADWIPERKVTIEMINAELIDHDVRSTEASFLRLLRNHITDMAEWNQPPTNGSDLFDTLSDLSKGNLANWLEELDSPKYENTYPPIWVNPSSPDEEKRLNEKKSVLMPHLVQAFLSEHEKWQQGELGNSCIRIGPMNKTDYALYIPNFLQFMPTEDGTLPPRIVLDGTADPEIYRRILKSTIIVKKSDIAPAPGTQHFAIRIDTGNEKVKRYGKKEQCAKGTNFQVTIKECRYMLKKVDPDGEAIRKGLVGLISFEGCIKDLAEALDIPIGNTGYYWGVRGSNQLEKCTILLLVGTPSISPYDLITLARAIYRDDPEPLKETSAEDWKRTGKHTDPRIQRYADNITNGELTQAAHRIRPVCHANKIIISFCSGTIDNLPITETVTEFPELTEEGESAYQAREDENEKKIREAFEELSKGGKRPTVEAVREKSNVRKDTAAKWMRENHPKQSKEENKKMSEEFGGSQKANSISNYSLLGTKNFSSKTEPHKPVVKKNGDSAAPTRLTSYRDLHEGMQVTTPDGPGIIASIAPSSILKRVRIAVNLDGKNDGLHGFDVKDVQPLGKVVESEKPVSQEMIDSLDALFSHLS